MREEGSELRARYERGETIPCIARSLGMSDASVWKRLKRAGTAIRSNSFYSGTRSCHFRGCQELSGKFFQMLRRGARVRGIEVSVSLQFLWSKFVDQGRRCALSGEPLTLQTSGGTASVDRIDSKKGYTPSNIQWVHKTINMMKRDLSEEEFIELCHRVSDYQRSKWGDTSVGRGAY